MKAQLEESQLVLCTVDKISGTTVFVRLDDYSMQGSITFPEISPGRIRNIRDFVVPGKKIVCKVLAIKPGIAELSLRRVKTTERNEFNDLHKKEKSYIALLKSILADRAEGVIEKLKEGSLVEIIEKARDDPKLLEKYLPKEDSEKIIKILNEKRPREITLSKRFSLSSKAPNGIILVKNLLNEVAKNTSVEYSYIAAGKYLIKIKGSNPKTAEAGIDKVLELIEDSAKSHSCNFLKTD